MSKKNPPQKTRSKTLSPAYARRIERARAAGKTLQEARGHRAKEHVARREREKIQLGGLTGDQIRAIRRWYTTQYNPDGTKSIRNPKTGKRGGFEEEYIDLARKNGYESFSQFRKAWGAIRRTYVRDQVRGTYISRGDDYAEDISEFFDIELGDDNVGWLYYH